MNQEPRTIDPEKSQEALRLFRLASLRRAQQWDAERALEILLGSTNPEDPDEPEEINVDFGTWAVGLDLDAEDLVPDDVTLIGIADINREFEGTYIFTE